MTRAEQLAAFAASLVVVLAAVAAAARYLGRRLLAVADRWRHIEDAIADAAAKTAELAERIREQLGELIARKEEDHRALRSDIGRVDDRLQAHESFHMEQGARRQRWRRT